jgi:hypothetical protein
LHGAQRALELERGWNERGLVELSKHRFRLRHVEAPDKTQDDPHADEHPHRRLPMEAREVAYARAAMP